MHKSSFASSLVLFSRNREKLVALPVYSSVRQVATSMPQRICVITSSGSQVSRAVLKWGVKMESVHIQCSKAAHHSDTIDCDDIRLVVTEHV